MENFTKQMFSSHCFGCLVFFLVVYVYVFLVAPDSYFARSINTISTYNGDVQIFQVLLVGYTTITNVKRRKHTNKRKFTQQNQLREKKTNQRSFEYIWRIPNAFFTSTRVLNLCTQLCNE